MPKCPKQEQLLEFATLASELSASQRIRYGWHKFRCADCRKSLEAIQQKWQIYFTPEPETASSLIKVFSKLQKDETLILKGWKLGNVTPRRAPQRAIREGWLFRGGVSVGVAAALVLVLTSRFKSPLEVQPQSASLNTHPEAPLAQIRYEEKNGVQVHYVKPELLQSIEFETTSGR